MRAVVFWAGIAGCGTLHPTDPNDPCLEAGYAIAYVNEVCTGDVDLGNARFEAYDRDYRCLPRSVDDPELAAAGVELRDLYGCAFAIRQIPCDVVTDYGAELERYLDVSEACSWVAEAKP